MGSLASLPLARPRRAIRIALGGVVTVVLVAGALVFGPAGPASAVACSGPWSGTGTSGDPFLVKTRADLVAIDTCMTAGNSTAGLVWRQWGNISLGTWSPIGATGSRRFEGTYDGDCYALSGMSVSRSYNAGLFADLGSSGTPATVKNLKISNPTVTGDNYGFGALAGSASGANTIDTVIVTGANITTTGSYTGGLIGSDRASSITKVAVSGSLSGLDVGGIVGYQPGTIAQSSFTGTITGRGGFGLADGAVSISDSYAQATITATRASGFANGASGIAGKMHNSGGTITNSYSAATLAGSLTSTPGTIYGTSGTSATLRLRYPANTWGAMDPLTLTATNGTGSFGSGTTTAGARTTGSDGSGSYSDYALTGTGIVDGTVTNIYFSGIRAGIIGNALGDTISDTFFDSTLAPSPSSGVLSTDGTTFNTSPVTGVTPKSTLDMKTASTYTGAGWSSSIWSFPASPGAKYPTHNWVATFATGCSSGNPAPPSTDEGTTPGPQQTCGGAGCDTPPPSAAPVASASPTPSATSATQVQAALDPIHNEINGNVPGAGLPAGGSLLLVGGVPQPVTVRPDAPADAKGLDVEGPGFFMKLVGVGDRQQDLGVQGGSTLVLQSFQTPGQRQSGTRGAVRARSVAVTGVPAVPTACAVRTPMVRSAGTGFLANSFVKLYVLPGTYVGELPTDGSGAYSGSLPMPAGVGLGGQTLQANGFTPGGAVRSVSLGIKVEPTRSVSVRSEQGNVYFAPLSAELTDPGKATLALLIKKAKKAGIRTVVVGFVQQAGGSGNDEALSTQRARTVAQYLRSRGLTGAYVVRGDGHAGPKDQARRVSVSIRYANGC